MFANTLTDFAFSTLIFINQQASKQQQHNNIDIKYKEPTHKIKTSALREMKKLKFHHRSRRSRRSRRAITNIKSSNDLLFQFLAFRAKIMKH